MGAVFNISAQLEDMGECYKCGVRFGAPPNFVRARRDDKGTFYCPNGHPQGYTQSELDRLKAELEAAKLQRDRAANAQRYAETELKKTKTRYRNLQERTKNGVCPCCHRSFVQLARHMATKHPEYAAEPK